MCDYIWFVYGCFVFLFSSRRRHTRCALVTGVQTCALPILVLDHRVQQADVGGAGRGVAPAGEVEHNVVGVEVVAVAPLDALAQVEGPGLEVIGRFPALRQVGPRDVVRPGDRQVRDDVARLVRILRSEEQTAELTSLMRISYAVFCLKKKT